MPDPARPMRSERKTPEQLAREVVNSAGVAIVQAGFDAIDELAEIGKDRLKRLLISGISKPKRSPDGKR